MCSLSAGLSWAPLSQLYERIDGVFPPQSEFVAEVPWVAQAPDAKRLASGRLDVLRCTEAGAAGIQATD